MKEQRNFDNGISEMMFSINNYKDWEDMASDLQIVSEVVLEHNYAFLIVTPELELNELVDDLFNEFVVTIEEKYPKVVMTQIEGGIQLEFLGEKPTTKQIFPWDEC